MSAKEIEDLITKVTMNSAFLSLAKNDEKLISDMKQAILRLHDGA
jgi:hypothetical protein